MNKYQSFCQRLLSGKIPHQRRFYILSDKNEDDNTSNMTNVKLITPTQSSVEKARSEMQDEMDINRDTFSDISQSGGASGKKRKSTAKPKPTTKKKKKKSVSKTPKKKSTTNKKKKEKRKQKSKYNRKSFKWM